MNIIDSLKPSQLKHIEIKDLKKDSTLFRENELCSSIGIVLKGTVSIVTYLENGDEIIYNTLKTNEIFGNNLIFSSKPYYKGNIITNEDCVIALIQKDYLLTLLKNNETFVIEYLKIQSNFTQVLNNKIKLLSMDSAEERFYFYMHENHNKIEYASIKSLAKELYLERETLSRLLSKLIKQKKIIKEDKNIILKQGD